MDRISALIALILEPLKAKNFNWQKVLELMEDWEGECEFVHSDDHLYVYCDSLTGKHLRFIWGTLKMGVLSVHLAGYNAARVTYKQGVDENSAAHFDQQRTVARQHAEEVSAARQQGYESGFETGTALKDKMLEDTHETGYKAGWAAGKKSGTSLGRQEVQDELLKALGLRGG